MTSYFITGSSRGIGLGLAAFLAAAPGTSKVFASARSESSSLKELISEKKGRVEFVPLDVTSQDSAKEAASRVESSLNGKGLDILINNAGIMPWTTNGVENMNDLDDTFKINVTGVHYVTAAFLPLLKRGKEKKIINISTTLGSITKSSTYRIFPVPAYKVSKAALNMLTVQYALSLKDEGFTVIAVSPGVRTDLGSESADLSIEESIKAVTDIISRVRNADTGGFFNVHVAGWEKADGPNQYDGINPPW